MNVSLCAKGIALILKYKVVVIKACVWKFDAWVVLTIGERDATEFGWLCTTQLLKTLFSGHPLEIARCCLIAVNVFNLGCPIFGVYCANQYIREN